MKHHRLISRKPQISQISTIEALKNFVVELTGQIIEFVFLKTM